jgi:hypothetical protein
MLQCARHKLEAKPGLPIRMNEMEVAELATGAHMRRIAQLSRKLLRGATTTALAIEQHEEKL